jgi:hypothetical protein
MKRGRAAAAAAPSRPPLAARAQPTLNSFFKKPKPAAEDAVPSAAAVEDAVPSSAPVCVAWGALVRPLAELSPPSRARAAWGGRHYDCPFASDARHPSAGCGALDAIRRSASANGGNGNGNPGGAARAGAAGGPTGWQRSNFVLVLRAAVADGSAVRAAASDDDVTLAEHVLSTLPHDAQALLAALYYAPSDGWHRLSAPPGGRPLAGAAPCLAHAAGSGTEADADDAGETALRALAAAGLVDVADAALPAAAALLPLLRASEADTVARGAGVARAGASAAEALATTLRRAGADTPSSPLRARLLATLGPVARLAPHAGESLLRLHRVALVLAGYSPPEAAALLSCDIASLRLPFAACHVSDAPSLLPAPARGCARGIAAGAAALHAAAAACDALDTAAVRGDADGAYAALHEATTALLNAPVQSGMSGSGVMPQQCHVAGALWRACRVALCRLSLRGCGLLERQRRFEDACHYLRALRASAACAACAACAPLRAEAALRLALDLEHAGAKEEALTCAEHALGIGAGASGAAAAAADVAVVLRLGAAHVGLCRVAARLGVPPRRWRPPPLPALPAAPAETLHLPRYADGAWRLSTRTRASNDASTTPSVEAAVLHHYAAPAQGAWRGVHTENGPFIALFAALMRHVIDDVASAPGTWLCPLADGPLDYGAGIAAARPHATAARLAQIAAWPPQRLADEVFAAAAPDEEEAQQQGGVRAPHRRGAGAPCALRRRALAAVAGGLGGAAVAALCDAFGRAYDAAAAGFPDLIIWQEAEAEQSSGDAAALLAPPRPASCVRAVEVKGPGDRLSDRQRAAHALLLAAGVDARVCYVVATPA